MFLTFYLTIKAVHMQRHVGLFPIGRPLQQRQRIGPRCLGGRAWAKLCLLTGLDESVLQQRLAGSRTVVGHKPRGEFTWFFLHEVQLYLNVSRGWMNCTHVHGGNRFLLQQVFVHLVWGGEAADAGQQQQPASLSVVGVAVSPHLVNNLSDNLIT